MCITAIVGAGLLGAGASVVAGNKNANAIEKTSDTSLQANREAIAAQERAFQQSLAFQEESRDLGLAYQTDALNASNALQTNAFNANGAQRTQQYNNVLGATNPFLQTGYASMNAINAMLGLPQQKAFTPQMATHTPVTAPVVANPAATPAAPAGQTLPTQQPLTPAPAPSQQPTYNPALNVMGAGFKPNLNLPIGY